MKEITSLVKAVLNILRRWAAWEIFYSILKKYVRTINATSDHLKYFKGQEIAGDHLLVLSSET